MEYGRSVIQLVKTVDLQRLDLGIAMSHFELTARELSLSGRWQKRPPSLSPLPEFVRVSALKPDGPDQPGAQMAVAELEVYE